MSILVRPRMATPALETDQLTVAYGDKPVVTGVTLAVPPGSLTAVVGPNGAGKSTILKAVLGLARPTSGAARVFGKPYREQRSRVAYVPQRSAVDWEFPADALDVVLMGTYGRLGWLRRPGRAEKSQAMEALQRLGMAEFARRPIGRLSGGQQQRVFLARALVQGADLFLMDEPFQGVDAVTERAVMELLRELRDAGKTAVVVHHDLHTVPEYFDRVIMVNNRLIASGPVADVFTETNVRTTYSHREINSLVRAR